MKIKDLKGILYNLHGCPLQMATLWNFDDNEINEYDSGTYEYIINKYPEKEVKRIQADMVNRESVILIQTN